MKSNLNRNRLVHPKAQVLRQFLRDFALATAMRDNLRAVRPAVAHTASFAPLDPRLVVVQGLSRFPLGLQAAIVHGPRRVRLGLQPAVKHPCNPGHPERPQARRPGRKLSLCPAPRHGAVSCQVSSFHNKERERAKPADFRWFVKFVDTVQRRPRPLEARLA